MKSLKERNVQNQPDDNDIPVWQFRVVSVKAVSFLLGEKARRPLTPQDSASKPPYMITQSADAHGRGAQALEQTAKHTVCCQLVWVSSRWDDAVLFRNGNFLWVESAGGS